MKQLLKTQINRFTENIAGKVIRRSSEKASLADSIAYRVVLETIITETSKGKKPDEIFYGISDDCWFWLNTEGVRRNSILRSILPGVPDEFTQELFTGADGDKALEEAFSYYQILKNQYQKHVGDIHQASNILDFGCGWGRIIRFFLKDIEGSRIWGCDPVEDMIKLCREQNKWCNFEPINTSPPTSFQDNTFDLIYSFSVFSHLSEDLHLRLLPELKRILKPGGIYVTTTRNRQFIEYCGQLRKRRDLNDLNPGVKGSSQAFPDTQKSLSTFDQGLYCHHSFNDEKWPFWGETAIPKKYVLDHWSQHFTILSFLELEPQNVIVVQKFAE